HFEMKTGPAEGTVRLFDASTHPAPPRPSDFSALALGDDLFDSTSVDGAKRPVPFVPIEHDPEPRADSWRAASGNRLPFRLHRVTRALRRLTHWQRASFF